MKDFFSKILESKNSGEKIIWFFLPILLVFLIKISNKNDLRLSQFGRKRWSRQIFNYLRNDNDIIEKFDKDNKIFFYKKSIKKKKRIKICGIDEFSKVNVNTKIPKLQLYCSDKKKFLYVVSPKYTPLTIFIDSYTEKEKNKNFQKYVFKSNKEIKLDDLYEEESENDIDLDPENDIDLDPENDIDLDKENIDYEYEIASSLDNLSNQHKEKQKFPIYNKNKNIIYMDYKDKSVISNKNLKNQGRFVKKPLIGSQGKGIEIIDNFEKCFITKNNLIIDDRYIFQEEIIPKLIDGYKFDIRYFAVIVIFKDKIEIKHIPYAMVRLCSKKYSLKDEDLYSNLTNTSLNKDVNCTKSISKNDTEWTKCFEDMEKITNDFFSNVIEEVGEDYFYKINENSIASTRIIGFDFIISESDEMFILESNYAPGDNTHYGSECKDKVIKYYAEDIIKTII
jgi:hypothetical protein